MKPAQPSLATGSPFGPLRAAQLEGARRALRGKAVRTRAKGPVWRVLDVSWSLTEPGVLLAYLVAPTRRYDATSAPLHLLRLVDEDAL